jgi:hypothetical protein
VKDVPSDQGSAEPQSETPLRLDPARFTSAMSKNGLLEAETVVRDECSELRARHGYGRRSRGRGYICLEGDVRTAAVAGKRAVTPVDVPGIVPGDPKEPNRGPAAPLSRPVTARRSFSRPKTAGSTAARRTTLGLVAAVPDEHANHRPNIYPNVKA